MSTNTNLIQEKCLGIKRLLLSFLCGVVITSGVNWFLLEQNGYKSQGDLTNPEFNLLIQNLDRDNGVEHLNRETKYSKLSNTELKKMVEEKRDLLLKVYQEYKKFDSLTHYSKKLNWNEKVEIYNQQSIFGDQMISNYQLYDKVEVILLREQILLRLPQDYAKKSTIHNYEYPTNPIGFKNLLDDFSKLIYLLQ